MIMKNTTLCYIEAEGCYLLIYRNKKKNDVNQGKWIGIGGHFEPGESAEDCLKREVFEECGFRLPYYRSCGVIDFISDESEPETMHLFHVLLPERFPIEEEACPEGVLAWVPKEEFLALPTWEGDRIFLDLMQKNLPPFHLRLVYRHDTLMESSFLTD